MTMTAAPWSAPVARVLAQLPDARHLGRKWIARCPAHDDHTPSLAITEGADGRALVVCRAGCSFDSILRALGMEKAELFVDRKPSRATNGASVHAPAPTRDRPALVASYDYTDPDGELLYQVCRMEPKEFRQRRPDPSRPGDWIWNMRDTQRVLYRLAELREAIALEKRVYVVEGEKDADALRAWGLTATTNSEGAHRWSDAYAPEFRDAHVAILSDNDDAGRARTAKLVSSLTGIAADLRVIDLPGLPEKGDVSDWIAQGGTLEQLDRLVVAAHPTAPGRTRYTLGELMADPEMMRLPEMVIPLLVALARSTLLYAVEKIGKSTFVAYLLARKSRGGALFGREVHAASVLLIGLEEFVGDVVRRLAQFDGHPDQLHIVTALDGATIPERMSEIRRHIEETRPALVVIDTLIALVAGKVESTNSDAEMQPIVQGLTDLAHTLRCGMLIVAHATKSTGSYRGSSAIGGSVDVLAEMTVPEDEDDQTARVIRVRGRIQFEDFRVRYTGSGYDVVDVVGDIEARVLDVIARVPQCSHTAIRTAVTGKNSLIDRALVRLVERGAIIDAGSEKHHAYELAIPAPTLPHAGAGRAGQDIPRPCATGAGPGQGAGRVGGRVIEATGQRLATLGDPPLGGHRVTASPETGGVADA